MGIDITSPFGGTHLKGAAMFFECKVYNKKGKVVKVHTSKELEERDRKICLAFLPDIERKVIENYTGEYHDSIQDEYRLGTIEDAD